MNSNDNSAMILIMWVFIFLCVNFLDLRYWIRPWSHVGCAGTHVCCCGPSRLWERIWATWSPGKVASQSIRVSVAYGYLQIWVCGPISLLCIFFSMGVFYHCPTSFTTMGFKLLTDQENFSWKIFSTPTVMVCATSDGSPPFYAIITLAIVPGQRTSAPTLRSMPLSSPRR